VLAGAPDVKLRDHLFLFVGVTSLVPLVMLGWGATRISSQLLQGKITDLQSSAAVGLADHVDTWVGLQFRLLQQQVQLFPLERLRPDLLSSYLKLVYRQSPEAQIVSLQTPGGEAVVPALYRAPDTREFSQRDGVSLARLAAFRSALPLDELNDALRVRPEGVALRPVAGAAYVPDSRANPVLPVVVPVPGDRALTLGLELALDPLARRFERLTEQGMDAALLGADGAPILPGPRGLVDPETLRPFLAGVLADDIQYETPDGQAVMAACAPVPTTGWTVVIAEPMSISEAVVREIQLRTAWVALVAVALGLVLSLWFVRQLSGPVLMLQDAAMALAEGDLSRRVEPVGSDELTDLARAFNHMSERLQESATQLRERADQIQQQQDEITRFNAELRQRVAERTAELEEAHSRLIQSARLAAVGEMGAGLAHELNNPLAAILGMTQILVAQGSPKVELLRSIEEQALKCKEIVAHLLGFSQEVRISSGSSSAGGSGPLTLDRAPAAVVDLGELLGEVLTLMGGPLRERGIEVAIREVEGLRARGDRAELGRAMAQLLTSLGATAGEGARLDITGEISEGHVAVSLLLRGDDLRTGSDDWMASGMGFWMARRVISAHSGHLEEPTIDGPSNKSRDSALWRVVLPAAS